MVLSEAQIQTLIIEEVGETDPPSLADLMPLIWDSYADQALIHPRLQELYSKRRAIDVVLGKLRNQVSFSQSGQISMQLNQRLGYLKDRRDETLKEIEKWEQISRGQRPSVIAPLIRTEVEDPPLLGPDANDPRYRGSPYVGPGRTDLIR